MSKLNKIITNNSVQLSESEINNLIMTLGPVIEAFTGGGGGQGSVIYTPGDDNISINNTQHTIALSTDAATKLNTPIPTKVSDLTDSANYATEQYVQAASAEVTGWVNDQNYLTQVPDTYYLKTETSGKDELSAAFNDILKYNVTAAAGIQVTTATDAGVKIFGISMTAQPVVTDTTLSGYNGIAATRDGEVNNQWNIGLTQDQLNTINGKLDSSDFTTYTGTTAPATYQLKGDYATEQYVQGASAEVTAWVNNQGFLTEVPNTYALKTDIPTTVAELTDSGNYYKKTETSGASELTTEFAKYVTNPTSLIDKYLVLRTDSNGAVSGWCDFQDQSYSKSEALGTFVATANIDTTTLSGDGKSVSTKLGVKTDVIATRDYTNSSFLPTSGGTISGATYFSAANGQNMLAVASAATLIGASRQTSGHFGQDTQALGTTWIGVGSEGMHRGFLKYTQGGNVGDLNTSNTMQVEFTPNNKGTIFAKAKNNDTDCPETQILNPTKASCDAMVQSANANLVSGPNYMLAKNADGQFVIGAACVNCTAISDITLSANTYYFVYEV